MSDLLKKYGGLMALAGMAGAAGVYAAVAASDDSTDNTTFHTLAAGMSQVRANADTCTVSGNTGGRLSSHNGQTFNFTRGTLTQRWSGGSRSTAFADLDAHTQALARDAHALLPASAACPPPVFVRQAHGT